MQYRDLNWRAHLQRNSHCIFNLSHYAARRNLLVLNRKVENLAQWRSNAANLAGQFIAGQKQPARIRQQGRRQGFQRGIADNAALGLWGLAVRTVKPPSARIDRARQAVLGGCITPPRRAHDGTRSPRSACVRPKHLSRQVMSGRLISRHGHSEQARFDASSAPASL